MTGYLARWRALPREAWLYLAHAALLTGSLAITSLLYNLTVLALGYERSFLGLLNVLGVAVAAGMSLPIWWLAGRVGLRRALVASALLQAGGALTVALWPTVAPLLLAASATGVAAILFQVTAAPFMMRHSDDATRDHLFSANAAVNLGVAGLGSLLAGQLPGVGARLLGVSAESPAAYRLSFAAAGVGLALSLVPLLLIRDHRPPTEDVPPTGEFTDDRPPTTDQPPPSHRRPSLASRLRSSALRPLPSFLRPSSIPEPWREMLHRPWPIAQLLIPPVLISWGAALLIPYLNLFFKERFGVSDGALGAIFAALGLVTGVASLAGPLLSARLGKPRTVALTQALSIPFLLIAGFVPLLGVAVAAALARGALFNMGSPLYDAFAMERSEEAARPTVIGLINAAYASGYLVAPAVSTLVQERWGFAPLFAATAACYALAVLATAWFFGRGTESGHR
jgi:MFS family permease